MFKTLVEVRRIVVEIYEIEIDTRGLIVPRKSIAS